MSDKPSIIISPGDTNNEALRVREANARFKQVIEDHRPPGVGYIIITFESPLSLKRGQLAMASDHDLATVERVLHGILSREKPRVIA